jgi:hypothetical protein
MGAILPTCRRGGLRGDPVAREAEAREDLAGHHAGPDARVGSQHLACTFEGFREDRDAGNGIGDDGAEDRDHSFGAERHHATLVLELDGPGSVLVSVRAPAELVDVLMVMVGWGDRWLARHAGPPLLYRHRACGEISHVDLRCAHCGEPMHSADVDLLPGPGAAD